MVYRPNLPPTPLQDARTAAAEFSEKGVFVWLDLSDPTADDMAMLRDTFALHPLAIEDACEPHDRSKIDSYEDFWYIVVTTMVGNDHDAETPEIVVFAAESFVVTIRRAPYFDLAELERRWNTGAQRHKRSTGLFLYTLMSEIVDRYFPVVDAFEDKIDALQDAVFEGTRHGPTVPLELLDLKRGVQQLRREALPLREVLHPMLRNDLEFLDKEILIYVRDAYKRASTIVEQLDAQRDLINSVIDVQLSLVANRQAEANKQLTFIATIFLPMMFTTGFFGQNFDWLVENIKSPQTFWIFAIGLNVASVVILMTVLKVKRFF